MKYIKKYCLFETYHGTDSNSLSHFMCYHRTGKKTDITDIKSHFTNGFNIGSGSYLGYGLYGTYDIESQLNHTVQSYGKYIIDYKIENNGKFIIFDYPLSKKLYGTKYLLIDQLKKVLKGNFNQFYKENKKDIDKYNISINDTDDTQIIAHEFSKMLNFTKYVDGCLCYSHKFGKEIVVYNLNLINLNRYGIVDNDNIKWYLIKNKTDYNNNKNIKSVFKRHIKLDKLSNNDIIEYFNFLFNKQKNILILNSYELKYCPENLLKTYFNKFNNLYLDESLLSDDDFLNLSDESKKDYVISYSLNEKSIEYNIFYLLNNELKMLYIKNCSRFSESCYLLCNESLKKYFISIAIIKNIKVCNTILNDMDKSTKNSYIMVLIDNKEYIPIEVYKSMDDKLKLKYIDYAFDKFLNILDFNELIYNSNSTIQEIIKNKIRNLE